MLAAGGLSGTARRLAHFDMAIGGIAILEKSLVVAAGHTVVLLSPHASGAWAKLRIWSCADQNTLLRGVAVSPSSKVMVVNESAGIIIELRKQLSEF